MNKNLRYEKAVDLLCTLLECGYLDLDILLNQSYDIDELVEDAKHMGFDEDIDLNSLIYAAFEKFKLEVDEIVRKSQEENPDDEELQQLDPMEDLESYVNYIDSHIYVSRETEDIYQEKFPFLNDLCKEKLNIYLW